jgi:hypothetical protein
VFLCVLLPSMEFAVKTKFLCVVADVGPNPLCSSVFLDLVFDYYVAIYKFLCLGLTETLVVYGFLPIIGSY